MLVVTSLALAPWMAQSAADQFEPHSLTFLSHYSRLEVPADLDGNGHLDFVSSWVIAQNFNSIWIEFVHKSPNAPGGWYDPHLYDYDHTGPSPGYFEGAIGTVAGDFDGDGLDEAVVFTGESLRVYEEGANQEPERTLWVDFGPIVVDAVAEALVLDFNGDGLDDLVLVNGSVVRLVASSIDAQGGLQFTITDELPAYGGPTRLAAIDVWGSPVPELILLQDHGLPTLWTIGVENGHFGALYREFPRATAGGEQIALAPGDVDGDGDVDAILFGHDGEYQVATNENGALAVAAPRVGGPATMLADLDGDGDLDGICCGGGGGSVRNDQPSTYHISLNQGGLTFESAVPFPGLGAHKVVAAYDFDDDGDVDVFAGRNVLINRQMIGSRYCAVPANSTGVPGEIQVSGSLSLGLGGPTIRAHHLPPGAPAILLSCSGRFIGNVFQPAFWDGRLCVNNSPVRIGLTFADAAGVADFGATPNWNWVGTGTGLRPDEPFAYQVWYRDVRPGGSGASVTDAVRMYLLQ